MSGWGRGVLPRGLHPAGGLPKGVCMQGALVTEGLHLGGSAPGGWGSAPRGVLLQGSCIKEGGLHPAGCLHPGEVCIGGGLGRPPNQILRDTVNEREVHILLECILVIIKSTKNISRATDF